MAISPLSPTMPVAAAPGNPPAGSAPRSTPEADAARFLELYNQGKTDDALRHYASVTGRDVNENLPAAAGSYEFQLLAQIGGQQSMRNFVMHEMPRLFKSIPTGR